MVFLFGRRERREEEKGPEDGLVRGGVAAIEVVVPIAEQKKL